MPTSSFCHLFHQRSMDPPGPPRVPAPNPLQSMPWPLWPPLSILLGPPWSMKPHFPPSLPLPWLQPRNRKDGRRKPSAFRTLHWLHLVFKVMFWFSHPRLANCQSPTWCWMFPPLDGLPLWMVSFGALLGGSHLCFLHSPPCYPLGSHDLLGTLDLPRVAAASLYSQGKHTTRHATHGRLLLRKRNLKFSH